MESAALRLFLRFALHFLHLLLLVTAATIKAVLYSSFLKQILDFLDIRFFGT